MALFSSPHKAFLCLKMVLVSGTPSGSTSKCLCRLLLICFLSPSAAIVCTSRTTSSTALECMVVFEAVAAARLTVFHWQMSGRLPPQQSCRRQPCRLLMRQTSRRQCCRLIMRRSCRRQCCRLIMRQSSRRQSCRLLMRQSCRRLTCRLLMSCFLSCRL